MRQLCGEAAKSEPNHLLIMSVAEVNRLIETCHFQQALRKTPEAKITCMDAIKLLNKLSKHTTTPQEAWTLEKLSVFAIQHYDSLKQNTLWELEKTLLWLNSKALTGGFYPIVYYDKLLTSADEVFLQGLEYQQAQLEIPNNLKATFQPIEIKDWSRKQEELINLHQDLLSNCSFVSSFLSLVHSGFIDELVSLITPSGPKNHYNVIFNFNGCKRKVTVDNKLPIMEDPTRFLTIRSNTNLDLYWPALIEKAYLEVMGKGYNIDGSNMAFDTYMLTGWIPEIFKIQDGRIPKLLKKIYRDHVKDSNITLGMGTGKISKKLSEQVGLISHHDYVLLSAEDDQMVLKNPWLETEDKNRIVKIHQNELFQFRYAYVNWNTSKLFQFKTTSNFIYHNKSDNEMFLDSKPQFGMQNPTSEPQLVWIFLERFIKQPELNADGSLISVDIYKTVSGDKVLLAKEYKNLILGEPTNGRCKLRKFTMEPNCYYTLVVNCSINTSMSLTVFNNVSSDFQIVKSKVKYLKRLCQEDEWDFTNSGGNRTLSTYLKNPQFDLEVKASTDLLILLLAPQHITFQIFYWNQYEKNKSMRIFKRGDLLVDEPYNLGIQSYTLTNVEPGHYRIICSCNNDNIRDKFKLYVYHDSTESDMIKLDKVTSSLGLFLNTVRFDWKGYNRHKIRFSTKEYNNKVSFHISFSSSNFLKPETSSNYRPSIRGSLFHEASQRPVQINEEWDNGLYGVFFDSTIEAPGNYILLVERFEPGYGYTEVECGSNKQFSMVD